LVKEGSEQKGKAPDQSLAIGGEGEQKDVPRKKSNQLREGGVRGSKDNNEYNNNGVK